MPNRYTLYSLFFLSGATGLLYEVLWHRKLTLIFGSTIYAAATILSVFFSGLALGAYLMGRAIDRRWTPIATYAVLEGLIGLFGICSPLLFARLDDVYLILISRISTGLVGLTTIRFILAYLALLLPTTLMGATLPVLVKFVAPFHATISIHAGRLYGINTMGAAVGALLGAIVVVPVMGVNASIYATGVINIAIGATAFIVFRTQSGVPSRPHRSESHRRTAMQKYILIFFSAAGFISMVYQVAWIRALAQICGSTVYSFGLILSLYIAGIGLGSEVATRLLPRMRSPIRALISVEIAASLYTLFLVNHYDHLPVLYTYLNTSLGLQGFVGSFAINLTIIAVMLLFPTLMFGAAFPLVASAYVRDSSTSGGDVGTLYALNTIGGVLGSFIGGFVLLPYLGTQVTIVAMSVAGLALAVALAMAFADRAFGIAAAATGVASLALAGISYGEWNVRLMDSAPYIHRYASVEENMRAKTDARLLYYKEGINVNVSVFGGYEAKTISINGKSMASVALTDKANQYLLGHLPMLLHRDPRQSLVIGLGAGMTFSSLVRHGQPADVVELSPEVVEGARLFRRHNHSVLDQPNATLVFNDGRNYLKTTSKKYDVITEDPLDPFFMGSGYLYNVEHFQNAKRALNPNGVMCQYLPLYQVGLEEAKIIIKSFHEVFPYVTAWFAFNDMLLIGSEEPLKIDVERLRERMSRPEIASDLREIGIDNVYDFLSNYLFDEESIPNIVGTAPLNTDDFPIIEYMTPRALFRDTPPENVSYFSARRANNILKHLTFDSGEPGQDFVMVLAKYFRAKAHIMQAHLRSIVGDDDGALSELSKAIDAVRPHSSSSYYVADAFLSSGTKLLNQGEARVAVSLLEEARRYRPDHPELLNAYAEGLLTMGRRKDAVDLFNASLGMEPDQIPVLFYLAQIYRVSNQYRKAKAMVDRCLALEPRDATCLSESARIEAMASKGGAGL